MGAEVEDLRLRLEESEANLRDCEEALQQAGAIGKQLLGENAALKRELEECRLPAKARNGSLRHSSSLTSSRKYSALTNEDEDGAEDNCNKPGAGSGKAAAEVLPGAKLEKWQAAMRELVEENQELERECSLLTQRCRTLEERCQAEAGAMDNPQAEEPRPPEPAEPRMATVVRSVISGMRRDQREGLARAAEMEEQSWVEAQTRQVELHDARESLEEAQRRNSELQRQLSLLQVEAQRAELRREVAEREVLRLREELSASAPPASAGGARRSGGGPPPALEGDAAAAPAAEGCGDGASVGNLEQQLERLSRWHRRTSHHAEPRAAAACAGDGGEADEKSRNYFCRPLRCLAFFHSGSRHASGAEGPACRRPSFGN